jgi:DNA-binding protein HU-beta
MSKLSLDQFALEVSDSLGMNKKDAKAHIAAIFEILAENVAEGHEVNIPGFAKFRRKDRPARQGRNPKTGETMEIAAKQVPHVLFAKALKEACNDA